MSRQVVILKAGTKLSSLASRSGDFEQWIAEALVMLPQVVPVAAGAPLPPLELTAAVVITGSGANVTEHAPWMERAADWLREAVAQRVPVLGICFGHQLLAYALGGEVAYNPGGVEVGTVQVRTTGQAAEDCLMRGLPPVFAAQSSHRQVVTRLPPASRLLASSSLDPHQAFGVGESAWGVQFHPEFDVPVVRAYVEHFRQLLEKEGKSADALLAQCQPAPHAAGLLQRFRECAALEEKR